MSLTDEQMWKLWNAQGSDFMDQKEAIAFARAATAPLLKRIAELERELATERSVSFRDQVAQLERELEALRKDAVWQPIETAPKDGTQVLLFYKGAGEFVAKRVSAGVFVPEYPINGIYSDVWLCPRGVLTPSQPLMWMPLPPPPDAAKENQ
jgi:hypothetical protein